MSRLATFGAESTDQWADGFAWTGSSGVASCDATVFRSGARSFKYDTGAAGTICCSQAVVTTVSGRNYYVRGYLRKPANPGTTAWVIQADDAVGGPGVIAVRLTTTGTLQLWNGIAGTQIGADSAALNNDQWYRVELGYRVGAGATDYAELLLDGVQVAVSNNFSVSESPAKAFYFGWVTAPGFNKVIYWDDCAINDDQGAAQNSWPGDGKVLLALPISDGSITNWTAGAGGATNLFAAIDNIPPAGVASASETDSTNVESASNSGTANYSVNLQTYATLGIGAADTINAVQPLVVHGEDVGSSTKSGSVELTSNPAIGAAAFTFGNDVGAHSAFRGLWVGTLGNAASAPSVTLTSSPVLKLIKTDFTTRTGCVCLAGAYVDYTPGVATKAPPPHRQPWRRWTRARVA